MHSKISTISPDHSGKKMTKMPKGKLDTLSPLQESWNDAVPACVDEPDPLYVDRPTRAKPASVSSSHVRTVVEICCSEDSQMGVKTVESQGCRHVRITVKDDFMKDETVAKIIREIRGEDTILWFSMPCTGGSPWQKYNMKHKSAREKMKGHWKVHKCMWKNFEIICEVAMQKNAFIINEWPDRCM